MVSTMTPRSHSSQSGGCNDCLGRIPYASLISFLLTCLGVGFFCFMFYKAFNSTLDQAGKLIFLHHLDFHWLDKVLLTFVLVGVAMGVLALVLLIVGFFATGSTRDRVYSGWRARLGGRVACALLLALSYLCLLAWLVAFGVTAICLASYELFDFTCRPVMNEGSTNCIDLSLLQPVLGDGASLPANDWRICHHDRLSFCQSVRSATQWYALALVGASCAVVGLVHFLVCLAANYAHIKDGFKYFELDEVRCNEENELMATYGQHSVYRH